MVIGGYSYGPVEYTYFYDLNEGEWINGPSLMQGRYGHAAGIFTDEETGEHFVALTGGLNFGNLDSTEILQEGEWIQGKISNIICYLLENFLVAKYSYIMSYY